MFGGSANLGTLVAVMRMDTTAVKQAELQLTAFGAHVNKVMHRVGSAMAAVFTVRAVTNMAKGFMNTAVEMEKYRTSLVATIKDVDKANEAFHRMYEWAAANPVDVDEAVASFVRLKTAAVKNSEEMVKVLADAALVMHQPVTVAANAVISTNAQMLRKLGVQVDRTRKQAIVRSGNFRVAVTKDIDSIRAAILDALKHQFGGAMKEFGDTWSGALKTIRGQYQIFQSDVMGSAGDGGPFDTLRKMIVQIREEWIRWRASSDYTAAVKGIQAAIVPILEFISNAYVAFSKFSNLVLGQMDKISLAFQAFMYWKVLGWVISGVTLALTYFRREVVLIATGTSLVARFASAIATWKLSTGIIEGLTGALTTLLTPKGVVMVGLTVIVGIAYKLDEAFTKATAGVSSFNKELRVMPIDKLEKLAEGKLWQFSGLASIPMINQANEELERRRQAGWGLEEDAGQSASPYRKPGAIVPDDGTSTAIASKVSKYEGYIQKMKDEVKYLGANAKDFLVTLDAWASKLKPLSDDWKLVKDYSMEIRAALSKEAGKEVADHLKRIEEVKKQQEEAQKAAAEGVERFWSKVAQGRSMGLIQAKEYFDMLHSEFAKLKETLSSEAGGYLNVDDMFNWTDEMMARFSELQSAGNDLANLDLTNLNNQLRQGLITKKEWITSIEMLMERYREFPLIIEVLQDALAKAHQRVEQFTFSIAEWSDKLAEGLTEGFANAIVYGENLGDSLRKLGQEILAAYVKALLFKHVFQPMQVMLGNFFGFAQGGVFMNGNVTPFARGGVVKSPTLFPMAKGLGLMGEAGPEAVMPLARTSDGSLGVKAQTSASDNPVVVINVLDKGDLEQVTYEAMAKYPGSQIVTNHVMRTSSERGSLAFGRR